MNPPSRTSVLIPLHNGARTIGDALDSVRRQTVRPQEVVVVDDGSTDDGPEIARRHPLAPQVITLPRNCGVGYARNAGLAQATGDWVATLDQDDLWAPWRLARLESVMAAHPDRTLLVSGERAFALETDRAALADHPFLGWVELWGSGPSAADLLDRCPPPDGPPEVTEIAHHRVLAGSVTVTTSYMFDRRIALGVGGFASWLRSADDWVFLQAMSAHSPIHRVADRSVLYRVHPSNASLTTDWPMPLAVSAAAVRMGGHAAPPGRERDPAAVGRLHESDMLMHMLRQQVTSRRPRSLLDTAAAVQLLATTRADRRRVAGTLTRAAVVARLPTSLRARLRGLRGR